jgi:hypothetical protein
MNIELHIEHLVLDGLPLAAADGASVLTAVQTELTRLLTEGGLAPGLQQGGALTSLRGADVRLSPGPAPDAVGREIGAAVHEGLRA